MGIQGLEHPSAFSMRCFQLQLSFFSYFPQISALPGQSEDNGLPDLSPEGKSLTESRPRSGTSEAVTSSLTLTPISHPLCCDNSWQGHQVLPAGFEPGRLFTGLCHTQAHPAPNQLLAQEKQLWLGRAWAGVSQEKDLAPDPRQGGKTNKQKELETEHLALL